MPTAFMPLLDEGVDVWRPVELAADAAGRLVVVSQKPDDEIWAFPSGVAVVCEPKEMSGGETVSVIVGTVEERKS